MAVVYIIRLACVGWSSQFRIKGMSGSSLELSQMSIKFLAQASPLYDPIESTNSRVTRIFWFCSSKLQTRRLF